MSGARPDGDHRHGSPTDLVGQEATTGRLTLPGFAVEECDDAMDVTHQVPATASPHKLQDASASAGPLGWVIACVVGEGIGMTASASAARASEGLPGSAALAIVVAGGLIEGVALGVLQAAWLARRFPGLSRLRWIVTTVLIAGIGWALASAPSALSDPGGAAPECGVRSSDGRRPRPHHGRAARRRPGARAASSCPSSVAVGLDQRRCMVTRNGRHLHWCHRSGRVLADGSGDRLGCADRCGRGRHSRSREHRADANADGSIGRFRCGGVVAASPYPGTRRHVRVASRAGREERSHLRVSGAVCAGKATSSSCFPGVPRTRTGGATCGGRLHSPCGSTADGCRRPGTRSPARMRATSKPARSTGGAGHMSVSVRTRSSPASNSLFNAAAISDATLRGNRDRVEELRRCRSVRHPIVRILNSRDGGPIFLRSSIRKLHAAQRSVNRDGPGRTPISPNILTPIERP